MIKQRLKKCKGCGEMRYCVGHGLCSYCYQIDYQKRKREKAKGTPYKGFLRTFPLKATPNTTKDTKPRIRKAMAPRRKSQSVTDKFLIAYFGFKSQRDLFNWMWEGGCEQRCPFTGEDLKKYYNQRSMRHILCAHVLPKSTHKLWKLNRYNVKLVHPVFHRLVDQGTDAEREKYPDWDFESWFSLQEQYKKEYETWRKEQLL